MIYILFIVIHNHFNTVFRAVTGKENSAYKRRKNSGDTSVSLVVAEVKT